MEAGESEPGKGFKPVQKKKKRKSMLLLFLLRATETPFLKTLRKALENLLQNCPPEQQTRTEFIHRHYSFVKSVDSFVCTGCGFPYVRYVSIIPVL